MATFSGRKYGRGKYGRGTYDLGVAHEVPPWVPIVPPPDIWASIPDEPPWCEVSVIDPSAAEIWKPILAPFQPGDN